MVDLKWYRVTKIDFENTVQNGTQLKLKNHMKYNVDYMDGSKRCVGHLEFRVADEELNPFEIRVKMDAMFTYDAQDDKADIHTASFDQLFPFLRQVINGVTSMSGMPGLVIPMMHIDRTKVNIGGADDMPESSPLN